MPVLVPFDESEQSRYALRHAANQFPDRTITVLYVLDPFAADADVADGDESAYATLTEDAQRALESAVASLPAPVDAETVLRYGRPLQEILHYAEENDVEHVVVGSHGRSGLKRLFLGSVAEPVVRRAPVPVTVVREASETAEEAISTVLVPFDGSSQSKNALVYALEQYPAAEVTALYVAYPTRDRTDPAVHESPSALADWARQIHAHTAEVLELAETLAAEVDRSVETASVRGDPPHEIVSYAEDEGFDHVVMGSQGRDGLTRLLLGSVAETVVRRAPTSVTVVR